MNEEKRCRISREMLKHEIGEDGADLELDPRLLWKVVNACEMKDVSESDVKVFWLELTIEMTQAKLQKKKAESLLLAERIELAQAKLKELEEE